VPIAEGATGTSDLDVTVVGGCGHVGLPLALVFARAGLCVGIYDSDETKIAMVRRGDMPFLERGAPDLLAEALRSGNLELSDDPSIIKRSDAIVLVPGTPIDEYLNPSLSVFKGILDDIAPWLIDGALLVLRSTAYPGTTEWVERDLASRGINVAVAFCPERISEGRAIEELAALPQVIGADSDGAAERAEALFAHLVSDTIRTTSKEAELTKLFNNAWRYLKFAAANQFFVIADQAGVDYDHVLHALRDNYPRGADLPDPGFAAGPCLFKDTMQLAAYTNNHFLLGHAAMLANEGLPDYLVERLDCQGRLRGQTVAILGMAFKGDSDDKRASLSYKLRRLLWFRGATVVCSDPFIGDDDFVPLEEAIDSADLVVIGSPHSAYLGLDLGSRPVLDIWGITSRSIRVP
jgi:UDP-N-acetyl-D-mannosaminuronic acid dehydrogenase